MKENNFTGECIRKPYHTPKVTSPELIAVIPLAILATSTVAQMALAGAAVGAGAAAVGKMVGFNELHKTNTLIPIN
ncbi:MAG: hypothetical protein Q4C70_03975 [Planctomycetia bacterium]|nr:hypothetical protein [Planctomycetia bacterium]